MRALTIKQPWVHAILHEGKDIENRSWQRDFRGWLALHASAQPDRYARFPRGHRLPDLDSTPCSASLASSISHRTSRVTSRTASETRSPTDVSPSAADRGTAGSAITMPPSYVGVSNGRSEIAVGKDPIQVTSVAHACCAVRTRHRD
jgi:hypothetical protein